MTCWIFSAASQLRFRSIDGNVLWLLLVAIILVTIPSVESTHLLPMVSHTSISWPTEVILYWYIIFWQYGGFLKWVYPQFTSIIYRWFFHNHRAFFGYPHGNNPHILFSTLLWRPDFIGGCSGHARKLCPFIETCAAAERRGVGTLRRRCVASSKGTKSYGPLRSMMIHFMDEFNIF